MNNIKSFLLSFLFASGTASCQNSAMPLKEWPSPAQTPFVFYITGDGGFNDFSTDLCTGIHKKNYSMAALNARSYFWDKKTPEQSAADIAGYIQKQLAGRINQQLILIGYSFGADVLPFIVNKLPATIKAKLKTVLLLSPSATTDFEIHWLELLGGKKKRSMDVVAAINAMSGPPVVILNGSDEDDFPYKNVTLKNYIHEELPGGHHFGNDMAELIKTMAKYF